MSATTAIAFARAAPTYWLSVYPQVHEEVRRQRERAGAIPHEGLRRLASGALQAKRENIDGSAAFAAFVPRHRRAAVVRVQVAFQALYDYLDVLTEQPARDAVDNSRQLHGALLAALDPGARGGAYREHESVERDGGYLQDMVERCQAAVSALPGFVVVREAARRLCGYIVEYQSFNVTDLPAPREALASWAAGRTPPGADLDWWETAAAAGSSLGLLALLAMAAEPRPDGEEALAIEQAYFPWVGALHSLLDSLIDLPEDLASGQPALIAHYGSEAHVADRLARLAADSRRRVADLPHPDRHVLMLAAMASIYLAEPQALAAHARPARRAVLDALGLPAKAALAVMRVRRAALGLGA